MPKMYYDILFQEASEVLNINKVKLKILNDEISLMMNKFQRALQLVEYNTDLTTIPPSSGFNDIYQKGLVNLLKIIVNFLNSNDLSYWLDGGNLLGIVRHNGFIPWDDDIDISMLRMDYEKLLKIMPQLIDNYCEMSYSVNEITRIYLKRLQLQIDIIPYDVIYTDELVKSEEIMCNILNIIHDLKYDYKNLNKSNSVLNCDRNILIDSFYDIYHVKGNEISYIVPGMEWFKRWNVILSFDTVFPLKIVELNDGYFKIPANPEALLTAYYGNYYNWPKKFTMHRLKALKDFSVISKIIEFNQKFIP